MHLLSESFNFHSEIRFGLVSKSSLAFAPVFDRRRVDGEEQRERVEFVFEFFAVQSFSEKECGQYESTGEEKCGERRVLDDFIFKSMYPRFLKNSPVGRSHIVYVDRLGVMQD